MRWRDRISLACSLIVSVVLLAIARHTCDPRWLKLHLPAAHEGDGILWQVQTTFLSVGFAGLAIAAQLFADAPLAIGASRGTAVPRNVEVHAKDGPRRVSIYCNVAYMRNLVGESRRRRVPLRINVYVEELGRTGSQPWAVQFVDVYTSRLLTSIHKDC
ncbi:MAG: hypothetical protein QOE48_375 [Mycobacterium sp.]|nr:hypothetical protein [Mycobacterium sp.]MDT5275371.1 hypothetical protein [Mycobacterium sp.]MDT5304712.1 hypothetical protein [Mycobacterium sp.]